MSTPVVLLVEDSADDVDFARRALSKSGVDHQLVVAEQGRHALDLLDPTGTDPLRPDLVLLDLNIPGMSGHEVLARLKSDPGTSTLPVVILSTSAEPKEIEACLRAHANSYHAKPDDFGRYQALMQRIAGYWLETARGDSVARRTLPAEATRAETATLSC